MAPINLTAELLPLALPLTDPACLYTLAQRQCILDKLYEYLDKYLSNEEQCSFNDALNICVSGLTNGVDNEGRGWEGVKKVVKKLDEVRRADSQKLFDMEKEIAAKMTSIPRVRGTCPACVEASGKPAVTPSQVLDGGTTKDAATQTESPPLTTPTPITQRKKPFLRAFLNAVKPLCDDPAQYSEEQRSTFFKNLADFFQKNLTLDEQAKFAVTLDECCELSFTDPCGGNLMMMKMIHDVARERIERNVREAQIREVEEAMKGVGVGGRGKGKGKEKEKVSGRQGSSTRGPTVKEDVKPNCASTRIVRMNGNIPGSEGGTSSRSVPSSFGTAIPACAAARPGSAVKYTVEYATHDTTNATTNGTSNGTGNGISDGTSSGASSSTSNEAPRGMPDGTKHDTANGGTTQRKSSDSTTSPPSADAESSSNSPQSLPGAKPTSRIVVIPKILSRDLDILLSMPNPRRTSLYLRMILEPVTSKELILTADLQAKYARKFCSLLTQKVYDDDAARDGRQVDDDEGERAKKWGGILQEANFVGVLLRAIPGVELVINQSDETDERLWVRGVKEREVALTFAGTNRKREKKALYHYRQTGQVDLEPKNEFARKLAADPLFARDIKVPRVVTSKVPPHYRFSREKNTIVGGRDGEDSAFPGIGLKSRTNEESLKNFEVEISYRESVWPGVEMLTVDGHKAAANMLGKKRGLGRRKGRFEDLASKGVEQVIKEDFALRSEEGVKTGQ